MTVTLTDDDGRPSSRLSSAAEALDGALRLELKKYHETSGAGREWSTPLHGQEPELQEPLTAELWIRRLRAALHETQRNLDLISASYCQLQQTQQGFWSECVVVFDNAPVSVMRKRRR